MPNIISNWPYTDLHNLNLDWLLNKVQEYGAEIDKIPDIIREYIENITIDPATIGTGNQIFVDRFGAKGDGSTNDLTAINLAIAYCNDNGYTLAFDGSKTYFISGIPADIHCNVNGNGATLLMDNDSYLRVTDPANIDSMTIPDSAITNDHIYFSALYGMSFFLETPFSLGLRNGTGTAAKYIQGIQLDKDGHIVNGNMKFTAIPSGTYIATYCHNRYIQPITISNIHFAINLPGNPCKFMQVYRDNVTVENILMTGTSAAGGTGIHTIGCNITFRNIFGYNPNSGNTWGYILEIFRGDNITMDNVCLDNYSGSSWAGTQSEYMGNVTLNHCIIPRLDVHTQAWGDIIATNCSMTYANISGGVVNYRFENCKFITTDSNPIYTRTDWKPPIMGSLDMISCSGRQDAAFFVYNATNNTGAGTWADYFPLGFKVHAQDMTAMQIMKANDSTLNNEPLDIVIENCTLYPVDIYTGCVFIYDRPLTVARFNACKFPNACEPITCNDQNGAACFINGCIFDANCYFEKTDVFYVDNSSANPWQGRGACIIYLDNVTGGIAGRANSTFYEKLAAPFEVLESDWETALNNARLFMVDITRTDRSQTDHQIILIPRVDVSSSNAYFYASAYQDNTHTYTAVVRAKTTEIAVYVNTDGTAIANTDYTWAIYSF